MVAFNEVIPRPVYLHLRASDVTRDVERELVRIMRSIYFAE